MLLLAFGLLSAAAILGAVLVIYYLKAKATAPKPVLLLAHTALGSASLAALIVGSDRDQPRAGMGTAGFGPTAAILLAAALVFGLLLARATWQGRRPNEMLVGTHAGLAIAGFILLLALIALR